MIERTRAGQELTRTYPFCQRWWQKCQASTHGFLFPTTITFTTLTSSLPFLFPAADQAIVTETTAANQRVLGVRSLGCDAIQETLSMDKLT